MKPLFFDIAILEQYFNDPRYSISPSDYSGSISFSSGNTLSRRDQVVLQTFGMGYKKDRERRERVVAVYLRYLSGLTPKHQQRWRTYLIEGEECVVAREYYQNTILGEWADNVFIYDAFIEELHCINEMAELMFDSRLFIDTYKGNRPGSFRAIFIPAKESFEKFVLVLDKLMSENINKKFFKGKIPMELETERADGKVNVSQKGTINLLEEWFRRNIRIGDETDFNLILAPFRKVRRLRQKPAHVISADEYDKHYFQRQDDLIFECYQAIRMIRLLLANHPTVRNYKVPQWLFRGDIKMY